MSCSRSPSSTMQQTPADPQSRHMQTTLQRQQQHQSPQHPWSHSMDPSQQHAQMQQQQQRLQQQQQAAAAATHAAAVAAAAASPYGSVLPMTPAAWQMQQQQQRHMEMRAAIAAGNQAAAAGTAAPVAGTAAASADEDDSHSLSPSESAEDRSALQAADRSHRAALGRSSTRSAADSGKIEERSRLRRQQEREREAEMRDLMNDEEAEAEAAAAATPARSKNNSSSKHSSAAAAASSSSKSKSSGVLLDDVDLSEADLKLLDADTKSRTAHNKRMRGLIKEGLLKQERFVRRHLNQLRPFLSEKVLARYEPGGDAAADDQPAPVCKTFVTQPPYILNGQMREYQILGLNWMIQRHENCVAGILGDEMGLGKTLQVIAFLSYLKYERGIAGPHLIVVPLSVMSAWMAEFKRWSPGIRVVRYHGPLAERRRLQNDDASFGNFDVIVTSYEVVAGDEEFFRYKFIWQYVIVDEGHRIKNEKTLQAQALAAIQRYNVILLSGTPTQNNTHEIYSLLHFLLPRVFTSSEPFDRCFNLSTNSIDQEQLFRIHTLLKPIMLRRMKQAIEEKLPPKVETKIYVGLTDLQREWYKRLVSRDLSLLLKGGSGGATATATASAASQGSEWRRLMSLMMQLRKLCNHPYLVALESEPPWDELRAKEAAEDAARLKAGLKPEVRAGGSIEKRAGDYLINASGKMIVLDKLLTKLKQGGHRVLLFSLFTRVLDLLEDFFNFRGWAYLRLDGSTNRVRRGVDIRRFNDPNSKFFVYLISTRAGGLGINLTGADTVIHFDSDFNPQCDLQAQDRCHRIGQTKPVNVYRFVTENTVEERLISRAEKKLYLDHMVNRLSHAGNVEGAGGNGTGDISEQEELVKLTRDEMLSMLTFGASRIFKAGTGAGETIAEEDIDTILSRSMAKTDDERAKKLAGIVAKRAALAASAGPSSAQPSPDSLLAEDESSEIAQQRLDLQALNQAGLLPGSDMMELDGDDRAGAGGGEEHEEKKSGAGSGSAVRELPVMPSAAATVAAVVIKGVAPGAAASTGVGGSGSGAIQENAQMNVSEFLFSAPSSHIHEFEGQDFSAKPSGKTRAQLDKEAAAKLILPPDSGKRERKQRLVTIEDGRGKSFTILASQANDAPIPQQKRGKNKSGGAAGRKSIKKEEDDTAAAIRASLASSSKQAAASSSSAAAAASSAAAPAALPNEPYVVGHRWALDWNASTATSAADLKRAVENLNKAEESGADITEMPLVKLCVRRSDRWNVSDEEKAAYDRSVREEMQRAAALRNAKRKRWAEGAPEDQWLREVPAGAVPAGGGKGKRNNVAASQRAGAEGEPGYVYNTRYIHEDWCMLCKLGGDLLCCGYCPRTYHKECVGLSRPPAGYFSCPQHKCSKCERNSQEAGGMLFRCVVCPCAYCEDDVPTEYEGRTDLDRCFELEQTGYAQPSSAFFITCSKACTDYYRQYQEGKFEGWDLVEPIPVEVVESAHARKEGEEKQRQMEADQALAAVTAAAASSAAAGKKGRKGKKSAGSGAEATSDAAAAASSSSDVASAPAAAAASSSSDQPTSEFVFVPPTEMPPHVCACLMPRAKKPKLICICKTVYDKRRNYVACDACSQWYHLSCVGLAEDADVENLEFTCKACQLKEKQRAAKSSGGYELDSDAEAEESSDDEDSEDSGDDQRGEEASDSQADSDAAEHDDDPRSKRAAAAKKKQKQKQKQKAAAAKSKGKRKSRRSGRSTADDEDEIEDLLGGGLSKSRGKKQKIRHPVDGGMYPVVGDSASAAAGAGASAPFAGPTLEQALQQMLAAQSQANVNANPMASMSVDGLGLGDPSASAAAAATAALPALASMDPATLQAMFAFMQSQFSTGGIVAPDGTVSQAPMPMPMPMPNQMMAPPPQQQQQPQSMQQQPMNMSMPATQPLGLAQHQQQLQQQQLQLQQQQMQIMQQQQQNEMAMAACQQAQQ